MANSILKLKVETSEYDQKLANAAKGIRHLADVAHKGAGELTGLEKSEVDYIKALGDMETKSRSASGQVRELSSTYKELKVIYDQFNEVEKADEGGKALAASLETLKQRAQEAKAQLDTATKSLNDNGDAGKSTSGMLEALAGKLGLNVGQLTKFGGALAAATAAMEIAKGVIESTEATHDAFAKAVEVSDSITNQFLRSMANADFSNFINGLQGVIDKTVAAYEAMDEFESYAARFQPWQQAKESEIQTKLMQARAAKAQGDMKRAEQLNAEAKTLINQLATSTKAYGEKQTKGGFSTIRSLMGPVEISNQQIAWYADPKNWDEATRKAEKFAALQEKIQKGSFMSATAAQRRAGQAARAEIDRDPSLKRAYTMMNLRDSGDSKQAQQFRRALGDIYGNTLAESRIESLMARADRMDGVISGAGRRGTSSTTKTVDPIADAAKAVSDAENSYAQAIQAAQENLAEQIITNEQYNNTVLSGQRKLAEAYYSAYQVTGNEEYLNSYREAAEHVREQQAAIDANTAAQKAAKEAAEKLAKETKEKADQLARTELTKTFSAAGVAAKITDIQKARQQAVFGSEEYNSLTANLVDATTISNLIKVAIQDGIDLAASEVDMSALWAAIASGENIDDAVWEDLVKKINEELQAKGLGSIILNSLTGEVSSDKSTKKGKKGNPFIETDENGKETVNLSKAINGMADGISKVVGGVEQLGIKIPDGLKNVLGGIQTVTTIISGIASTVLAISAVVAADAIIPFARGGIVGRAAGGLLIPGNSMSGDRLRLPVAGGGMIGVNSGELILNRSQQDNIASQLEGGLRNIELTSVVRGEDIVLAINNRSRRMWRGEFVTSKKL